MGLKRHGGGRGGGGRQGREGGRRGGGAGGESGRQEEGGEKHDIYYGLATQAAKTIGFYTGLYSFDAKSTIFAMV